VHRHLRGQGFTLRQEIPGTNYLAFMLKTKSSSWIFSDRCPGSVELGSSVLKPIQIQTDSNSFHVFEMCDFIVLKTISSGYEDYEGLSAVVANSENATCSDFQQVTRSRNFRLFMLKMISRGYKGLSADVFDSDGAACVGFDRMARRFGNSTGPSP
jgi:hypothetical protein